MKLKGLVFLFALHLPFTSAFAEPKLTQESINELNREFEILLGNVGGNITDLISDAITDGLEGTTLDLEVLSESISGLEANLEETSCGIIDDALIGIAEVFEDHPLEVFLVTGIFDPLGITGDAVEHFRDNPLEPYVPGFGSLSDALGFGGSDDGWEYSESGTKEQLTEEMKGRVLRYIARWPGSSRYEEIESGERDFREFLNEDFLAIMESIDALPSNDKTVTISDSSESSASLRDHESGFVAICTGAAELVDSARDEHLNVIHQLLPQAGLSIESIGPIEFTNFDVGPGIDFVSSQEMTIEIPHNEKWSILVPITMNSSSPGFSDTFDVELNLKDFQVSLTMELEAFDNGKVDFKRIDGPDVDFDLSITSDDVLASAVIDFFRPALALAVGGLAQGVAGLVDHRLLILANTGISSVAAYGELGDIGGDQRDDALEPVIESFQDLVAHSMEPLGAPQVYEKTSPWPEMENIILNIDRKIRDQHMRYGIVTEVDMDNVGPSAWLSWKEAFSDGGQGNPGVIAEGAPKEGCEEFGNINSGYFRHQDAAAWTGTYLAALAHRYKVLPTSESKEHVEHALRSVERLFEVNDTENNGKRFLARATAPKDSPLGRAILCRGKNVFSKSEKVIDGEIWVSQQGGDGVSRDQYSGAMFGLNSVVQMVNDPALNARARNLIEDAVDYLISIDWAITEDHPLGLPTIWAGLGYQKVTFLTIANAAVPGKYSSELESAYKLLDLSWIEATVSILDPINNYYAQNLFYTNLYSYFMLETDPVRREKMLNAGRIKSFYLGHHNNAYFNMIRASYDDPALRNDLIDQSAEILKRLMARPHRRYLPQTSLDAIAALEAIDVDIPRQTKSEDGFKDSNEDGVIDSIPALAVDPALRKWKDQFFWQGSGFVVETNHEQVERELSGIDISLVYWMMRSQKQDDLAWLIPVLHLLLH